MTTPSPRTLVQRLGAYRWVAVVHRRLAPLDRRLYRLTGGRWFLSRMLPPTLLLTTAGRRTGAARTSPVLFLPRDGAIVVVGSNYGSRRAPAWALNLLAQPAAVVEIGRDRIPVRARVAQGEEREALWRAMVRRWPAFEVYVERAGGRDIRVFVLEPSAG